MHLKITEMSERCSELVSKEKVEACCCQCCGLTYYLQQNLADLAIVC